MHGARITFFSYGDLEPLVTMLYRSFTLINKNQTYHSAGNETLFRDKAFLQRDDYLCHCIHNLQLNVSSIYYTFKKIYFLFEFVFCCGTAV